MIEIKDIAEHIEEELEDAEKYAKCAGKADDKELMAMYADLSRQELGHIDKLHAMAVKMIQAAKAKGVDPPASMLAVWDWEHEKMIRGKAKIVAMLDMMK